MANYELYVSRSERISAERFLQLSPRQRKDIVSTKIVPPTLESNNSGFIELEHKTQRYDVEAVFS
jgi:hypothetical protein